MCHSLPPPATTTEDDDLEDGQDYDAEMSGLHMFRGQIDSVDLEGVDIAMGDDIVDGKVFFLTC